MPGEEVAVGDGVGSLWTEDVTAVDAEVLATYAGGPLLGRPALTRRSVGDGASWYASTMLDDESFGALLDRITAEAGVAAAVKVPRGVEVVRRRSETGSWLFLLNDTGAEQVVPASGYDLVSDSQVGPDVVLAAGAVAVVREA
jgi:beta-galactosidase